MNTNAMNPEQVRAALEGIEQQARQYLKAKREGAAILHGYRVESLNPRWLLLFPEGRCHSSQIWDKDPNPRLCFDVPVPDNVLREKAASDYFRQLKHAYLDRFHPEIPHTSTSTQRAAFGLPALHPVTLPDYAADIAGAPDPNNPPPKPKAPKRAPRPKGEGKATAKDRALAQRIADRIGPERVTSSTFDLIDTARTLRRAQLTLRRWSELECGTDAGHIEREGDDGEGRPMFHPAGYWLAGTWREPKPYAIPDRERGALARVEKTCKAAGLHYYHQTDPRGCALYVAAVPLTASNYSSVGVPCL